jgi:aminoglycoside phosphotransferase (APT) family kinase protein
MLSVDDAKIVERDGKLPGLATLLDNALACRLFQHHVGNLSPRSADCTYLRYKPGVSCLAAFTVDTGEGMQTVHATAYRTDAADKLAKANGRVTTHDMQCPAPIVIPELAIVVSPFPCDNELPALERVGCRDGQIQLVSRLTSEDDHKLVTAKWTALRYKPERRYVARLDVDDQPQAVLKLHSSTGYAQARRAIKSLGSSLSVHTAQTLGHSDRHRAILTRWIAGIPLLRVLNDPNAAISAMEAAGRLLAQLHGQPICKLPHRSTRQEIVELSRLASDFVAISPKLAESMQRVAQRCSEKMARFPSVEVPLHGDCHPQQILIDRANPELDAALIDLDNAALGHPACDIGNLLAHLHRETLRGTFRQNQLERLAAALVSAYVKHHLSVEQNGMEQSAVQVYLASGLLRLAQESFRHRQQNWHRETDAMVRRALKVLDDLDLSHDNFASRSKTKRTSAERSTDIVVTDPFAVNEDLALANAAEAIETNFAREMIAPVIRQAFQDDRLEIRSIRVLHHKPGRRCLIEYSCKTEDSTCNVMVLGKVHAKSRHERSIRLQQALWESGFDYQSEDGISVARPIGIVAACQMWLQEHVPGTSCWHTLTGSHGETIATRIAETAHKLHQTDILTERVHTIDDELQILEKKLPQVVRLMPQLKSRIDIVLEKCRELANSIPFTQQTGIHRDFYPDQLLVNGDRIFLLDHDLYCMGDPHLDIGNFIGHLIEYSLRVHGHPNAFAASQNALIKRYCCLNKDSHPTLIGVYATLTLVRHIYLSTRIVGRGNSTHQILDHCESALARHPSWTILTQ